MIDSREQIIIGFIKNTGACSSKQIHDNIDVSVSYATLKRILSKLRTENILSTVGQGKGTKDILSPTFELLESMNVDKYYEKEIDEREIKEVFNFSIINEVLANHSVFTEPELEKLNALQKIFQTNISQLSDIEYKR
ncbi:MAG: hypothetical protein EA394_00390 [Bacteroidia bacterium]|nr:MAG: hypothetical protein EA394_00390 [Bacteroidia bacterium]